MKTNMIGNFRLRRLNDYNWTIEQRVRFKKENSKSRPWKPVGYYPTLDMACQRHLDRILLTGEDEPSARSLIREIAQARDYIATLILAQPSASRIDATPSGVGEPRVQNPGRRAVS